MIKNCLFVVIISGVLLSCSENKTTRWTRFNPIEYVNPLAGATSIESSRPPVSFPAPSILIHPRVSAADSAERAETGHSELIYGFSHTLSGGKANDLLIMPTFGEFAFDRNARQSAFSLEAASPGYYKTKLNRYGLFAAMTVTRHTAMHEVHFQDGWANILIDLSSGAENVRGGMLRFNGPTEILGYTKQRNAATDSIERVWFIVRFDRSAMKGGLLRNGRQLPQQADIVEDKNIGAFFSFRTLEGGVIHFKVALSTNSLEHAIQLLDIEQPDWSFPLLRQQAREAWQTEMQKIMVHGGNESMKKLFYTSFYRSLLTSATGAKTVAADDKTASLFDHFANNICNSDSVSSLLGTPISESSIASGKAAQTIRKSVSRQASLFSNTFANVEFDGAPAEIVCAMIGLAPDCHYDNWLIMPGFFEHIEIMTGSDGRLDIETKIIDTSSSRIRKIKWNDKPLRSFFLNTKELKAGGQLVVTLSR